MTTGPYELISLVDEYCQMGLNSSDPKHWEAALQDILAAVRDSGLLHSTEEAKDGLAGSVEQRS
jgi:hypothetical protein